MGFKDKTPEMQEFLNLQAQMLFGRTVTKALAEQVCVDCGRKLLLEELEEIDRAEWRISGLGPCCFPKAPPELEEEFDDGQDHDNLHLDEETE